MIFFNQNLFHIDLRDKHIIFDRCAVIFLGGFSEIFHLGLPNRNLDPFLHIRWEDSRRMPRLLVLLAITNVPDWHRKWGSGPTERQRRAAHQCKPSACMLSPGDTVTVANRRASTDPVQSGPTGMPDNPQPKLCLRSGWLQTNSAHSLLETSRRGLPTLLCRALHLACNTWPV